MNYSKKGKASKKKGYFGEKKTAEEITSALNGFAKPTPRSGGLSWGDSGDLVCRNNIAEQFTWEIKKYKDWSGLSKMKKWTDKARSESKGGNYVVVFRPDYKKAVAVMDWEKLLSLLQTLQGFEMEYKDNETKG